MSEEKEEERAIIRTGDKHGTGISVHLWEYSGERVKTS